MAGYVSNPYRKILIPLFTPIFIANCCVSNPYRKILIERIFDSSTATSRCFQSLQEDSNLNRHIKIDVSFIVSNPYRKILIGISRFFNISAIAVSNPYRKILIQGAFNGGGLREVFPILTGRF